MATAADGRTGATERDCTTSGLDAAADGRTASDGVLVTGMTVGKSGCVEGASARRGATAADGLGISGSLGSESADGDECWAFTVVRPCAGALFWPRPEAGADAPLDEVAVLRARLGIDPQDGPGATSPALEFPALSGAALAVTGSDPIARPTPRAIAKAPTRPT